MGIQTEKEKELRAALHARLDTWLDHTFRSTTSDDGIQRSFNITLEQLSGYVEYRRREEI